MEPLIDDQTMHAADEPPLLTAWTLIEDTLDEASQNTRDFFEGQEQKDHVCWGLFGTVGRHQGHVEGFELAPRTFDQITVSLNRFFAVVNGDILYRHPGADGQVIYSKINNQQFKNILAPFQLTYKQDGKVGALTLGQTLTKGQILTLWVKPCRQTDWFLGHRNV